MMKSIIFAALIATACAAPKVKVMFYGESLCPFCKAAIGGYVNKTLTAPGVLDIMDFDYVPFGNAFYPTKECGQSGVCWSKKCGVADAPADCFKGEPVCQHGPGECTLNIVEVCVKNVTANSPAKYMPFMYCMEAPTQQNPTIPACAASTGISYSKIESCVKSPLSTTLVQQAAKTTAQIPGGHPGVPYFIVDGTPLTGDLLTTVCKAYKGAKPAGCN